MGQMCNSSRLLSVGVKVSIWRDTIWLICATSLCRRCSGTLFHGGVIVGAGRLMPSPEPLNEALQRLAAEYRRGFCTAQFFFYRGFIYGVSRNSSGRSRPWGGTTNCIAASRTLQILPVRHAARGCVLPRYLCPDAQGQARKTLMGLDQAQPPSQLRPSRWTKTVVPGWELSNQLFNRCIRWFLLVSCHGL